MNLGDLRAVVREMLDDQSEPYLWSDETLNRYLNNAVREACIRARLLKDDADSMPSLCQYPVTAGQPIIKLKREILVVRTGMLDGSCHKLWALTGESMDRHCPTWQSTTQQPGTPQYMVMDLAQKTLRLYPTADVSGLLRIRAWRMPLDKELMATDAAEPVIALPDPEEFKHWVAHEAYLKKDSETFDATRSSTHLALFEQRFGSRPTLHDMARWADSPARVRHAVTF